MTDDEIGPNYGKHAAGEMSLVLANFKDSVIVGGCVKRAFFTKIYWLVLIGQSENQT